MVRLHHCFAMPRRIIAAYQIQPIGCGLKAVAFDAEITLKGEEQGRAGA